MALEIDSSAHIGSRTPAAMNSPAMGKKQKRKAEVANDDNQDFGAADRGGEEGPPAGKRLRLSVPAAGGTAAIASQGTDTAQGRCHERGQGQGSSRGQEADSVMEGQARGNSKGIGRGRGKGRGKGKGRKALQPLEVLCDMDLDTSHLGMLASGNNAVHLDAAQSLAAMQHASQDM